MAWNKSMAKNETEAFMFRELTDNEEREFRKWAREHPDSKESSLSHPVVNDELRKIKAESSPEES